MLQQFRNQTAQRAAQQPVQSGMQNMQQSMQSTMQNMQTGAQQQAQMEAYRQQMIFDAQQQHQRQIEAKKRQMAAQQARLKSMLKQPKRLSRKRKLKNRGDDDYNPDADQSSESDNDGDWLPSVASRGQYQQSYQSRTRNLQKIFTSDSWTQGETMALVAYVQKYGNENWEHLASDPVLSQRHNNPDECRMWLAEVFRSMNTKNSGPQMRAMPRKRKKRKKLSDDGGPMDSQNMPTRSSSRIAAQPRKQYQEDGNYIDKILEYEEAEHEKSKKEQEFEEKIDVLLWGEMKSETIGEEKVELEKFLIKIVGLSYRQRVWLTKEQMCVRFGEKSSLARIRNFWKRRTVIENERFVKWNGEYFNPDYIIIDRVIDHMKEDVKDENGVVMASPTKYWVKWCGQSVLESTWESQDVVDDIKIAEYKRYNEVPTDLNPRNLRITQAQVSKFYHESRTYKNGLQLRDYQTEGLNWLIRKFYEGKNCILADEMGLGKTIQSLSFIEHLCRNNNIIGPYLIVAPLSTLSHWENEIKQWTTLNVLLYHDVGGNKGRQRIRELEFFYKNVEKRICKFNILLTSYETCLTDLEHLYGMRWFFVVVDEGHRLKNKTSKLSEAFRQLKIDRRLLLTGTPIQNTVEELFNLLTFLEPTVFSNWSEFQQKYGDINDAHKVKELTDHISPFVLRRLKETVEKSIPLKEERIIEVELTVLQKTYYRAIFEKNRGFLVRGCTKSNSPKLMNVEMELRKCCNHPWLIKGVAEREVDFNASEDEYFKRTIEASGKMVLLDKLLPKLKREDHKALIFSQMKQVLDVIENYIKWRGYKYERLDGTTKSVDRVEAIRRFCNPEKERLIFLLTTRAGGTGLNLTAADTVIIFDSDWNPQQDIQAQARCHRIGQDRPVMVYRLITRNSYEQEMFERASKKLGLCTGIMAGFEGKDMGGMNKNDVSLLDKMLRNGAYGVFKDGDEAAKKFVESNIDEILEHSSRKVDDKAEKSKLGVIHNFTRSKFESEGANATLDINDANFWDKLLELKDGGKGRNYVETDADVANRLLERLTNGSVTSKKLASEYFNELNNYLERMKNQKWTGKHIPINPITDLCVYFCSLKKYFTPSQREEVQELRTALTKRRRKQLRDTLNEDNFFGYETKDKRPKRKRRKKDHRDLFSPPDYPSEPTHFDICEICHSSNGYLVQCDGPCCGSYHRNCLDSPMIEDKELGCRLCRSCHALKTKRAEVAEETGGKSRRFRPNHYKVKIMLGGQSVFEQPKAVKCFFSNKKKKPTNQDNLEKE